MNARPTIVVVGSPNAGKSTLINRLSGSRTTVVHETPGVTRDRKEVLTDWAGRDLALIDTGGFDSGDESEIGEGVRAQIAAAIEGADAVLFIVDGRSGPLAGDFEIAEALRRAGTPVVVAANKLDEPSRQAIVPELYRLGLGEPIAISALHGIGTGDLLDELVALLPDGEAAEAGEEDAASDVIPVVIVGRPNAGKSSLFNAIVGEPRTIVSEIAGTTRDSIDTAVQSSHGKFRFVDTAGMRKSAKVSGVEYYSYLRSLQSLDRAHVAVILLDASVGIGELDISIAAEATRRDCATIIAVNKCDLAPVDLEDIGGLMKRKLRQKPAVLATSAKTRQGIATLLASVAALDRHYRAHLGTRELNRALAVLAGDRSLPSKGRKRLKMYYIAQYRTSPPRIAIEINDRTLITREFGFYVENRLRAHFGLEGVPLIIDFKGK
jgi:GTP-binding protein